MSKQLELKFVNSIGTTNTISIDQPIDPVDSAEIQETMTWFVDNDIFQTSGGRFVSLKEARIVERNVQSIPLDL
ncbi:DUF2922 domain-containing protein [Bacillaceae bacterium SIJ1]|uniref:DUF2922 domain-containing protein n=1 Tax=Litoribacterium kuwaitense TaxID=1398745 RepID=UPI0013EA55C8|nr:DUF2922 domain-containing protein [Litoribacterium kuwaitense]NGP44829.1 DUF2922 domain-containing protein [Litoribacterium kuwaitense]